MGYQERNGIHKYVVGKKRSGLLVRFFFITQLLFPAGVVPA